MSSTTFKFVNIVMGTLKDVREAIAKCIIQGTIDLGLSGYLV